MLDRLGHAVPQQAQGARRLLEAPGDHRLRRRPGEGRLAREHLVEHGAERVDVGARIDVVSVARLLGAHIRRRAHRHPRPGQLGVSPERARDAEVGHEGAAVFSEQQILGLDVPMDHPVLVGVLERACRLARDLQGIFDRQLVLAPQPVAERLALDKRHGEPQPSRRLTGIQDREDMRMLEPRGELDLALKALRAQTGGEVRMEHLEGHGALVLDVLGEVDRRHAPAPELAFEQVAVAEGLSELGRNVGQE